MTVFVVDVIGIGVITLIVWCFWLSPAQGIVAAATTVGIQEIRVAVKGGYSPDTIRVEAGRPVRPVFNRQETDPVRKGLSSTPSACPSTCSRGRKSPSSSPRTIPVSTSSSARWGCCAEGSW